MFEALPEAKADAILGLMAVFRQDLRADKLDLGVGIYKDLAGNTPVMRAIKAAEQQLIDTQSSKAYISPTGSAAFCAAMVNQVFGDEADKSRIRCAQSVGGSGALRILADLIKQVRPDAGLWLSDPTWPNHLPLLSTAGFTLHSYPYYDAAKGSVDRPRFFASLKQIPSGDVLLLHGCCHNPTGADLDMSDWNQVIDICLERSLFPLIDLAYQGFGDGLEEDAAPVRLMAKRLPELVIAASCSKNLGLYRERVGAAILVAQDADSAIRAHGQLGSVVRSNYSMPPDHGANITEIVLNDATLNRQWREELEAMRQRMVKLRLAFSEALRKRSNSDQFDYIAEQKGMFSRLPLSTDQIDTLRVEHAIYIVGDGRINVAGLPENGMDALADAICNLMNETK
ncbi:MAG: amino acid aminotransferase [Granulosicoccus sp.]